MKNSHFRPYKYAFLLVGITLFMLGLFFVDMNYGQSAKALNWLFDQDNNNEQSLTDEELQILIDTYNSIQLLYIDDVDKEDLLEGALKGMVNAVGDPYSEYLNAQESEDIEDSMDGSFTGIGVQIYSRDGEITVLTPIDGTPAAEKGLQPNDVILEADGISLTDMDTSEVIQLIRGEIGSTVNLLIKRGNSDFKIDIERAEIPIITVTEELYANDPEIGIVKVNQFNGTTYDEMVTAIESLRKDGATSFVFDFRYNPGGLLDQALMISNMFLEDDDIIMHMKESTSSLITYQASDRDYGDFQVTEPYVMLINEGSASASEILAAAIKENTDNPILGTTSFGKGSVQTVVNSSELGELKITFAKWLTPSKTWIHDEGIEPTQEILPEPITQALVLSTDDTLSLGTKNELVESLGAILTSLGYEVNEGDYFDEKMQTAVEKYQKDQKLEVTGEVTGETAQSLNDDAREYVDEHDKQLDQAAEILTQEFDSEDQAA